MRVFMRFLQGMFVAAALSGPARAQDSVSADDARAITQVLQQSAADWSHGNLSAFMRSYEDSAATAFVTPGGLLLGYSAIKAHYAARYGTGQNMGLLQLTVLDERRLSPDYALVTGRFTLAGPTTAHGVVTLIFHKSPVGWRITYDHTS